MQLTSPPCCTEPRHVSPTADTWEPWNNTTSDLYKEYWGYAGRTDAPTLVFWRRQTWTALPPHKLNIWWTGLVICMPNTQLPKRILYSQLKESQRVHGGQMKCYIDNIKANLKKQHITLDNWEHTCSGQVPKCKNKATAPQKQTGKSSTSTTCHHIPLSTLQQNIWIPYWSLQPPRAPQVDDPSEGSHTFFEWLLTGAKWSSMHRVLLCTWICKNKQNPDG